MDETSATADASTTPAAARRRRPGRATFFAGVVLVLVGIAGYAVQLAMQRLTTPWYMPVLGLLGVILVARSAWQARSLPRMLTLALVLAVAGAEWTFLLAARLPPYTGPVKVGKPMPAFATTTAGGGPFTQHDLKGDENNVLVFFRGRW
jgi:hypothetical protein